MFKVFMVLMVLSFNVQAIELLSYKTTSSSIVKIDDSALEKAWASDSPACLKDGAKMLGVNKAFVARKLGYRDCSQSDSARAKHRALGIEVAVIKLAELSDAKIKQVLGVK